MTQWDGQGLPPAAQARIDRAGTDRVWSSLLSIRGQAGVHSVGLDPVGEVMGSMVEHIGFAGYGGCGMWVPMTRGFGIPAAGGPTVTSGAGGFSGFAPYVDALYRGYDTAMYRMLLEAQALGADGIVGVTCVRERLLDTNGANEFVARGTAVRARGPVRPSTLFATDLSGGDVAKALHAGWVPTGLVWGISVAIRHDDYMTRMAAAPWSGQNIEVPGYTELVTYARHDARVQFHNRAGGMGADAATVSDMSLRIWAIEPNEGHRDHVAEAVVVGNSLVRFHQGEQAPTDSRLVMPLKGRQL
ncbi:MAG TPA: heavy metal-binding domain-containing protein [Mycobacteriales bacterium]|nr:heavy metal-binding domain-containing protein [Mycobacteriales bacterium]